MKRCRAPRTPVFSPLAALCLWLSGGCIQAPEIVLVDRATALEHQAAGNFTELERKLVREGIAARPVPLTPDDLQALGIQPPPLVDEIDLTEADRVDALLVQHCIGETREGLLAETHESCRTSADQGAARLLVERVNRAREQLWHWQQARQPKTPLAELRRAWRQSHLRGLVCGGWLQKEDASWEAKQC
jgi:hypothetical protein